VARSFWILPRRLKAAAGPSRDPGRYDRDPDLEVLSIPANTVTKVKDPVPLFSIFTNDSKYRDPLHLLLEYLVEVSTIGSWLISRLCCTQ
jgi:hypothetical protein